MSDEMQNDGSPSPESEVTPPVPDHMEPAPPAEVPPSEPPAEVPPQAEPQPEPEPEPEPIPDPTPAELALSEINEITAYVDKVQRAWVQAKAFAKQAKEEEKEAEGEWVAAVSRQQAVIRGQSEKYPLFDRQWHQAKTAIKATVDAVVAEKARTAVATVEADPSDTSWRLVRLETLTIPRTLVKKLADASYHTIGQIADLGANGLSLTDIPGIGESKAAQIEEALAVFWLEHPKYCQPQPKPREPELAEPADTFESPATEFDPNSDSQTSDEEENN